MQFAVLSRIVMHCIVSCMYVYMYVCVYGWLEGWMYACVCLHNYMFIHLCVLMHAAVAAGPAKSRTNQKLLATLRVP